MTKLSPVQKSALKFDELMYQLEDINVADGVYPSFEAMDDEHIISEALFRWSMMHEEGTIYTEARDHYDPVERAVYRKDIRQAKAFLKKHCPEGLANPNLYWQKQNTA